MDYCEPCRRHLNGAFTCPGCGTPTEGTRGGRAYPEPVDLPMYADGADTEVEQQPGPRAGRRGRGAASAASRRDRKAAAHRRRRRRVLLIGAGFVLAVSGLSLAELGADAPGDAQRPAASGAQTGDGGAAEAEPVVDGTFAAPPPEPATPSASRSASPSPSPSPSASESESEPPDEDESPTAEDDQDQAPRSSGTTRPPAPAPPEETRAPAPAPEQTEAVPPPAPTPTQTCDRFLWWCA